MSYLKRLFLCTVKIKCLKIYGKLTIMHYNVFFIFKAILFFSILYATWHTAINRIIFNVLIFVNNSPFVDKNKNKKLLGSLYLNNLEKNISKHLRLKKSATQSDQFKEWKIAFEFGHCSLLPPVFGEQ